MKAEVYKIQELFDNYELKNLGVRKIQFKKERMKNTKKSQSVITSTIFAQVEYDDSVNIESMNFPRSIWTVIETDPDLETKSKKVRIYQLAEDKPESTNTKSLEEEEYNKIKSFLISLRFELQGVYEPEVVIEVS